MRRRPMVVATLADQAHIARDGRFATASKPQLLGDQRCGFAIVFDAQDFIARPCVHGPGAPRARLQFTADPSVAIERQQR